MFQEQTETVTYRHDFSIEELTGIASDMAEAVKEVAELEGEKACVTKSFKERIDAKALEVRTFGRKYRDKYELRTESCEVVYDDKARETCFVNGDGRCVMRRPMTAEERNRQCRLPLDDGDDDADRQARQ